MGLFSKVLIVLTIMGPLVLLGSVGIFAVGISIKSDNTLNPAGQIGNNAGTLKTGCGSADPYIEIINEAALQFNVDPVVIAAVIEAESAGNTKAVSGVGAKGLMQVMPSTWKEIRTGKVTPNIKEPKTTVTAVTNRAGKDLPDNQNDPEAAIYAGTFYLRQQLNAHNDKLPFALAAYNAGAGNVAKYRGVPPFVETVKYVFDITTKHIPKYEKCLQKATGTGAVPTNNEEARKAVLAAAHAAEGSFPAGSGQHCGLQAFAVYRKAGVKEASYNDKSNQIPSATAANLGPGDMVRISTKNGTANNDHMIILDSQVQATDRGKTVTVWTFWSADACHAWKHTSTDPSSWSWPSKAADVPYNPASNADGQPLQVWTPQPRLAK